jgi:hypothetical protein
MLKFSEVQKPAREFSHGLDFRLIDQSHTYHNSDTTDHYILSENEENIYNLQ